MSYKNRIKIVFWQGGFAWTVCKAGQGISQDGAPIICLVAKDNHAITFGWLMSWNLDKRVYYSSGEFNRENTLSMVGLLTSTIGHFCLDKRLAPWAEKLPSRRSSLIAVLETKPWGISALSWPDVVDSWLRWFVDTWQYGVFRYSWYCPWRLGTLGFSSIITNLLLLLLSLEDGWYKPRKYKEVGSRTGCAIQ